MSGPVLSVSRLAVGLRGADREVVAVNGIDFELQTGEVLALVGESGCGKTKTAEALMGLIPPRQGWVRSDRMRLGETDLASLSERAWRSVRGCRMSMVFQEPLTALDPVFRAGEQLAAVYRRHQGKSRREAWEAAAIMLSDVGFDDPEFALHCYPHQLSGGMRQRVAVAMALACQPQVLIADEPTTALDVTTQAQVMTRMVSLADASGTAILLITHDLGLVAQYCGRALVMRDGGIVEEAPVSRLFRRPVHPYTRELLELARRYAS